MTAHDHREFVEGCYRCDLSRDEVTEYMPTSADADMRAIIVSCAENTITIAEEFGLTVTVTPDEVVAGFDRWLSAHDAEVAAKALEGVYGEIREHGHPSSGAAYIVEQRIRALRASTGGENRG